MASISSITDVIKPRFSYYKLEEQSSVLACAKMIACAVANIFICIGNFFHECFFSKKEEEALPSSPITPTSPTSPPAKSKKVRFMDPLVDPNISESKTYEKRNKQGKMITVCDQGTYLPCVSETPLRSSMKTLKREGEGLEDAFEGYSQAIGSILPSDADTPITNFSPEDVALLKKYRVAKRIEAYIKDFEKHHGRKPTQEEFNKVFDEQKIAQIQANTERLLKDEARVEGYKQLLEAIKTPKLSPLSKTMVVAFGLILGAASIYYGSQLGNYLGDLGSHMLLSLKEDSQNILITSLGASLLTGLHELAFLRRGYNWGKIALAGSRLAMKTLTPSSGESLFSLKTIGKIGAGLTGGFTGGSIFYNGMKEYYNNQEFAVSNESKYVIRDHLGVRFLDKVKETSLNTFCPKVKRGTKEISLPARRGFERSYNIGKQSAIAYLFATTAFGLGVWTAAPLAIVVGFVASRM